MPVRHSSHVPFTCTTERCGFTKAGKNGVSGIACRSDMITRVSGTAKPLCSASAITCALSEAAR